MDVNWIHLSQDGFHWLSQRTFGFHKRRGIFWPAERLSDSHEGVSYKQCVCMNSRWTSVYGHELLTCNSLWLQALQMHVEPLTNLVTWMMISNWPRNSELSEHQVLFIPLCVLIETRRQFSQDVGGFLGLALELHALNNFWCKGTYSQHNNCITAVTRLTHNITVLAFIAFRTWREEITRKT
jgi:hypothetical protein